MNIPELKVYDQPVAYSDKFLGVILDSRLRQTRPVQGKTAKRMSILKCLAGRDVEQTGPY